MIVVVTAGVEAVSGVGIQIAEVVEEPGADAADAGRAGALDGDTVVVAAAHDIYHH